MLDLGPEGGDKGGEIVAEGTPEDVVKESRSYTGHYLKPLLEAAPVAATAPAKKPRKKKATVLAESEREAAE